MPTEASSARGPAPEGRALRIVRGALVDRLPLKAVALFFALVLWLAVSADEQAERTVPVRVALRVDSSLTLLGAQPTAVATLTGRRRDLIKLRAGELVLRRTVGPGAADSVRLVLRPGDVELPAGVEGDLRVRDLQPRQVTLRFSHPPREVAGRQGRRARPRAAAVPTAAAGSPGPETTATTTATTTTAEPRDDTEPATDTLWESHADSAAPVPPDQPAAT